jgi:hypothetical protein
VIPYAEIAVALLMALAVWLIWDSLKAREAAVAEARRACGAEGFLFLDDTVAIESLRPIRDDDGQVRLRRVYAFEYSDTGNNREKGSVIVIAGRVVLLRLASQTMGVRNVWH